MASTEILNAPVNGSGYNERYGLLGSNKAAEDTVKLFPRDAQDFVLDVQRRLLKATGKHVEVMIYGDGAFTPNKPHLGAGRPGRLAELHRRPRRHAERAGS